MNPLTAVYFGWMKMRNLLDYNLRQRIHPVSRPVDPPEIEKPEITGGYPAKLRNQAKQEIDRLTECYHFDYFFAAHTYDEARENYFYLSMLDKALEETRVDLPDCLDAADIGPSSWFYVRALYAALTWHKAQFPRSVHLAGFEVDAYRLYADFQTRKNHALGNMHGLPNVEYFDRGFKTQPDSYHVITQFFPFVFEKDHLQWGLPANLFSPAVLRNAAWNSLQTGGLLVIVNQGLDEHRAELKLLETSGIPVAAAFHMDALLYTYPLDRYIITAIR